MSKYFFLFTLVAILAGCHKSTKRSFHLNSIEYACGETLDVKVSKEKKKNYWVLKNSFGEIVYQESSIFPQYTFNVLDSDGTYLLQLYDSYNEFDNRTIKDNPGYSKNVLLKSLKGELRIFNSPNTFTVYVDGHLLKENVVGDTELVLPVGPRFIEIEKNQEITNSFTVDIVFDETTTVYL